MTNLNNTKPFSLILGDELKPFLHEIAQQENRSIAYLIRRILMEYKVAKDEEGRKWSEAEFQAVNNKANSIFLKNVNGKFKKR